MQSKIIKGTSIPEAYKPNNLDLVQFVNDGEVGIYFVEKDEICIVYPGPDGIGYDVGIRNTLAHLREYNEKFVKFQDQLVLSN